jgi:hypothetical protein
VTGYGTTARSWATFPAVPSCLQWLPSLDPLRGTWLAGSLQQMPRGSKLSSPSYRHEKPVSSVFGYKPWCHSETDGGCQWCLQGGLILPSAAYLPSVHQSQSKVPRIGVFVTLVFETTFYIWICLRKIPEHAVIPSTLVFRQSCTFLLTVYITCAEGLAPYFGSGIESWTDSIAEEAYSIWTQHFLQVWL